MIIVLEVKYFWLLVGVKFFLVHRGDFELALTQIGKFVELAAGRRFLEVREHPLLLHIHLTEVGKVFFGFEVRIDDSCLVLIRS